MKAPVSSWLLAEPPAPFNPALAGAIDHPEQIAALQPAVRRLLLRPLGMSTLADRFCPVEREDGTVTLFTRAEHVGGDQAEALLRRIRDAGHRLSAPDRYVLPAALLLSLSRGEDRAWLSGSAAPAADRTPTALSGVFQDLLEWGVRHGATDLHLNVDRSAPQSEVRYTVAGRYVAPERFRHMPTDLLMDMLSVVWMDIQGGNGAVFDPLIEQQGSLLRRAEGRDLLLRWASLASDRGPSVCLRILERDAGLRAVTLQALGYQARHVAQFERVLCAEGGAVVLAGTVGSGKSTTLATVVRSLPDHRKIITLEEPVEYRIDGAIQNTISRDLDRQAHDRYATKLRTLKRSAMSDVLLGEIRDAESGLAFMDLAGSGVNVYTTVHAPSARAIVDRLASRFVGVPRDFLETPGVLKLLVFQVLLPRLCPACASEAAPGELARQQGGNPDHWRTWLGWIEHCWHITPEKLRLRNPAGCPSCRRPQLPELAGYEGRTVAAELREPGLWATDAADDPYRPDRIDSAMAHAMEKVAAGLIDPRDVEPRFMAFETLALRLRSRRSLHGGLRLAGGAR
ncbi:MAG: general secretion pathway protein [Castellaniella sp.]|uniref:ATPase, T2SS/T4P/T4SS family n=1 Tax=Castellaniella sp. TaxID=1955812 RepID=UPI0011F77223|nr:ATPase, T2SS/T4P/T4SS family [Castellaniella sp.]TAN26598.1 MAG: general secretion pathway protein [Castellaniella sp.]